MAGWRWQGAGVVRPCVVAAAELRGERRPSRLLTQSMKLLVVEEAEQGLGSGVKWNIFDQRHSTNTAGQTRHGESGEKKWTPQL